MALVVVRPALHLARADGQQWLRPVEWLNLALFVNAEHQGVLQYSSTNDS